MRMMDSEREQSVLRLALYLDKEDAKQLILELSKLLEDPEASEHFHMFDDGADDPMHREISCSIVTDAKLSRGRYTKLERKVFDED